MFIKVTHLIRTAMYFYVDTITQIDTVTQTIIIQTKEQIIK